MINRKKNQKVKIRNKPAKIIATAILPSLISNSSSILIVDLLLLFLRKYPAKVVEPIP